MKETKKFIYEQIQEKKLSIDRAKIMLKEIKSGTRKQCDIAVIGMSGRFPGAENIEEYWDILTEGVNCVTSFPNTRSKFFDRFIDGENRGSDNENQYIKGGYLKNVDLFDAKYFKISKKEAESMEPAQRLMLTIALEAAENAGYGGEKIVSSKTGVIIGRDHTNYDIYKYILEQQGETDANTLIGSYAGILASRISYVLNLTGPSTVVDTACSSSLVAIHQACEELRNGTCKMAFAGGIHLILCPINKSTFELVESKNQMVRPFDNSADGTMWGEGAGILLLKPLDDAIADNDTIHAIIKGSAMNNDGKSNGITSPNAIAQQEVYLEAWKNANINPETISYIEAHGTGTPMGDPMEISSLVNAFNKYTHKKQFCGIGTVKSNFGHSGAASGILGIIKVILAMKHKIIPKHINFQSPNSYIDLANSQLYIVDKETEWKISEEGIPRRAAISSFGMSGTNCHMVLEEAPSVEKSLVESEKTKPYIFTISGMDQQDVVNMVNLYVDYFNQCERRSLADICYTSTVGRGHYKCRLALIVTSLSELQEKLVDIKNSEKINSNEEQGIYFGEYKIVSGGKANVENGEIKEEELVHLKDVSNQLLRQNTYDDYVLSELCKLYMKGTAVEWSRLYQDRKYSSVDLPVYPLKKITIWPEADLLRENAECKNYIPGECILDTYKQHIYETKLHSDSCWFLNEHVLMNQPTIPGTVYIEWLRKIGEKTCSTKHLKLENVRFLSKISQESKEPITVQTIVEEKDDRLHTNIVSKKQDVCATEWKLNVEGDISVYQPTSIPKVDIEKLKSEFAAYKIDMGYRSKTDLLEFGDRWDNIVFISKKQDDLFVHLKLKQQYKNDFKEYMFHPALMDIALNAALMFIKKQHLPYAFKQLKIYDYMPDEFYSCLRKKSHKATNEGTITFDVTLSDKNGNVFAECENYTIKELRDVYAEHDLFHCITWNNVENIEAVNSYLKTIVVIGEESNYNHMFIHKMKEHNMNIIHVVPSCYYEKKSNGLYLIGDSEADFVRLLSELKERKVDQFIFLNTNDNSNNLVDLGELKEKIHYSIQRLFYLAKAFGKVALSNRVELILISKDAYRILEDDYIVDACSTGLLNMGKVINAEYPGVSCRGIDVDRNTHVEDICIELLRGAKEYLVAFRNGKRYTEEIQLYSTSTKSKESDTTFTLKKGGVYLITGGIGGIGLEIARYMASFENIVLVLLSRHGLPQRSTWEKILQEKQDVTNINRIQIIKEIEEGGSQVVIQKCDISSITETENVLKVIENKYGNISGIIHAAGIINDTLIQSKSWEDFENVIAPKVYGSVVLDSLVSEKLDFFVFFSSISTVTGGPGQSDYVVANAFMEGYASYLRGKDIPAVVINWTLWKETGLAVQKNLIEKKSDDNYFFLPIKTNEGLNSLNVILQNLPERILVGKMNYQLLGKISDDLPIHVSRKIKDKFSSTQQPISKKVQPVFHMEGRQDENYTNTERIVASIWAKIMLLDSIDIYDDFYDLGGDSILATNILWELNAEFPDILDMSDIFVYPTICDISEYIDSKIQIREAATTIKTLDERSLKEQTDEVAFDLSAAQYRIWFLQKCDNETTVFQFPVLQYLDVNVKPDLLQVAINLLAKKHAALTTVIKEVDGIPKQYFVKDIKLELNYVDFSDKENPENAWRDYLNKIKTEPLACDKALVKMELHQINKEQQIFYMNIHHIISDGWSINIIKRDLMQIYDQLKNNPNILIEPQDYNYIDYMKEEEEWYKTEDYLVMEQYWLDELKSPLPMLNLPTDYERPKVLNYDSDYVKFSIDATTTEKLKQYAHAKQATIYMMVLASYFLLLHKLSNENDIIVGFPVNGRMNKNEEDVVGLFMNMTCIRVDFSTIRNYDELLQVIRQKCLVTYKNSHYPFNSLVEKLNPEREQSTTPIFSTMFQLYDNIPQDNAASSQYDLECICRIQENSIVVRLEYRTSLFKKKTIEQYGAYFRTIIKKVAGDTKEPLDEWMLIDSKEKNLLLSRNIVSKYQEPDNIYDLFAEKVKQIPNQVAITFGERSLSYIELECEVSRVANCIRKLNLKMDEPIGFYLERGIDLIVGLLGILKSGHPYISLDVDFPQERIEYMISHSGLSVLVTNTEQIKYIRRLQSDTLKTIIDITSQSEEIIVDSNRQYISTMNCNDELQELANVKSEIMYIIYTSGSTGKPKGVMVTHRNAINYILWSIERFGINSKSQMMLVTSTCFDISVFEIFGSLLSGAVLNILSKRELHDPNLLFHFLCKNNITVWHSVPTFMSQFLLQVRNRSQEEIKNIKLDTVLIGGEAWTSTLAKEIKTMFKDVKLFNLYGPTEATIWISCYEVKEEEQNYAVMPLGDAVVNNSIIILDKQGRLCPQCIEGEICIIGANVTPGYYKDLEKTQKVFCKHSFCNEIVYHTGDIGRYNSSGILEYSRRMDGMVKIRGYRVETGEIENELMRIPEIKSVAVVAVKEGGTHKLVCYYTSDELVSDDEFRGELEKKLPHYMIPSLFIRLEKLPQTLNGKINKKELQERKIEVKTREYNEIINPVNDIEQCIVNIWKNILELDEIYTNQNFFQIGGNSNLIVQMQVQIEKVYPNCVSVIDLFELSTVKKIADHIINLKNQSRKNQESDGVDEINDIMNVLEKFNQGHYSTNDAIEKLEYQRRL